MLSIGYKLIYKFYYDYLIGFNGDEWWLYMYELEILKNDDD